jgi:hypothetical protein
MKTQINNFKKSNHIQLNSIGGKKMSAIDEKASEASRMAVAAYQQGDVRYGDRLANEARNLRRSRDIRDYDRIGTLISRGFEPGGTLRRWARGDD